MQGKERHHQNTDVPLGIAQKSNPPPRPLSESLFLTLKTRITGSVLMMVKMKILMIMMMMGILMKIMTKLP